MVYHPSYRCMSCDYNPLTGGGKGDVKPHGKQCDCPDSHTAMADCPLFLNYQKHMLEVHNIRWG